MEDKNIEGICPDCGGEIKIRNPTGKCDHLYYPENKPKMKKQKLKQPIPLTQKQYECQACKKKFYINIDDIGNNLACPFCENKDVPNIREFDVEVLAIGVVNEVN